jgi:iron complex outermembrane receptor protein
VFAVGLGVATGGVCLAQTASHERHAIRIASQPLGLALQALGNELKLQIVYRSAVVGQLTTPGISGELNADEALAALLADTGLTYHYLDEHTVTIVPVEPASGGATSSKLPDRAPVPRADAAVGLRGAAVASAVVGSGAEPAWRMGPQEVIVTAEKTTEVASKTPLSLSVYSGHDLREQGITSVAGLQDIDSVLNVGQSPSGVNISIRGVATTDVSSKGDQAIVFDIDGVPVGRPREMGLAFFDLERVEVLRGPQGTLYGKSSTGGAINVITNKPEDTFSASATLEYGDYDARRGSAVLNVPVTDSLALRAAGAFDLRDGYLDPRIDAPPLAYAPARQDQNNQAARLSALWSPVQPLSVLITGTAGRVGGVGNLYNAIYERVSTSSGSTARAVYYNPLGGTTDDDFRNVNAELNAQWGPVHVTYDGARILYTAHDTPSSEIDPAANPNAAGTPQYGFTDYRATYTTVSHEVRLSNATPQRIDWVIGANHYHENLAENDQNWNVPVTYPTFDASTNATGILGTTTHTSYGLFGQGSWHVSPALKLTLGLRDSSDRVSRRATFAGGPLQPGTGTPWLDKNGQPCHALNACVGAPDNGDEAASKITYRLGADYQLTDEHMVYFFVATGYKAGGFNDYDPVANGVSEYAPEQLTAYEVGYKGQLHPGLQYESAAYYYDYSRNQVTSVVAFFNVQPPTFVIFTRAVPAVLYGWENELRYGLTAADEVDLALALESTRYRQLLAGLTENVDWSGTGLDNAPRAAGTLAYTHRWYRAGGAYVQLHMGTKFSSGYDESDFVNAVKYRQGGFTRSDLTLSYRPASRQFGLDAYVHNIEDRLQLLSAPTNNALHVADGSGVAVSAPRTVGIRITVNY